MVGVTLIVLVIAQQNSDPASAAFERAARRALGRDADIQIQQLSSDPPDDESIARASNADGVVELLWASDGTKARIHCYLRRDARWVDREISFGVGTAAPEREAAERGRLLGFAVATMFTEEQAPDAEPEAQPVPEASPAIPAAKPRPRAADAKPAETAGKDEETPDSRGAHAAPSTISVEFAGIVSSGLDGTAAGLGATAGLRLRWLGPLWGRLFVSGRSGNIPRAQASTRYALLGAGLAFDGLPPGDRFELGLRLDAFASYFDATHYSRDDDAPDRRSRWLPGTDLVAEVGVHLGSNTGLFLGAGLEAVLGKTDIYVRGTPIAVVPPLRAVGEFGFRTKF